MSPIAPIVMITGAASGIGLASVEKLLNDGFRVCGTDRAHAALETLIDRNPNLAQARERLLLLPMDVTQKESILEVESHLLSKWGAPGILVNSAGLFETKDFTSLDESDLQKLWDVNLMGVFRTTQIFSKHMIERKNGKIINISSIAATKGAVRASHYAASKGALSALSLSLATELSPWNIQVNLILPGFVDTPMVPADQHEKMKTIAAWRIPVRRMGQAWEVAEAVSYLANSKSSYLTGSQILIDGGFSLG